MARKREVEVTPKLNLSLDARPEAEASASGTLLRGLDVLTAFRYGNGKLGNAEIAVATGFPRATVSRLTKALLEAGYLEYDGVTRQYQLRPRVLTLGFALLGNLPVIPIAHPQMMQLAESTGCTISMAAPDGNEMIYLDRCTGGTLPYFFGTGSVIETATTAGGQAYLAGLQPEKREEVLARLRPLYAGDWQRIVAQIEAAVLQVAERGFATVNETWRPGVRSVAAPMVSRDKKTIFSVSCVSSTHMVRLETLEESHGPAVVYLANQLSKYL